MHIEYNNQYEVLIADDNSENLRVLGDMLKGEGYKIRVAKNGRQVLSSIEVSEPNILLLDIFMPELNGFEVCKSLKEPASHFKHLPVIFISALSDTNNKNKAFEVGAADYVTKPFDANEIKTKIKTHLYYQGIINKLENQLNEKEKEIEKLKQMNNIK